MRRGTHRTDELRRTKAQQSLESTLGGCPEVTNCDPWTAKGTGARRATLLGWKSLLGVL